MSFKKSLFKVIFFLAAFYTGNVFSSSETDEWREIANRYHRIDSPDGTFEIEGVISGSDKTRKNWVMIELNNVLRFRLDLSFEQSLINYEIIPKGKSISAVGFRFRLNNSYGERYLLVNPYNGSILVDHTNKVESIISRICGDHIVIISCECINREQLSGEPDVYQYSWDGHRVNYGTSFVSDCGQER